MADSSPEKKENDDNRGNSGSYIQYDAGDIQYFGAQGVIEKELEYIRQRRAPSTQENGGTDELALTGLALSGGGIRSASFSLGVMQALAHNGWLKNFDYLSTVSGGGYIGASVSWLLSQEHDPDITGIRRFGLDRQTFPYGTYPMSGSAPELRLKIKADDTRAAGPDASPGLDQIYKGKLLRYLRQGAKYLTPGDGIDTMSLVAVILRGALVSLSVYFGLLLALFILAYPLLEYTPFQHMGLGPKTGNIVLWAALVPGGCFILYSLIYAWTTRSMSAGKQQNADRKEPNKKSSAYIHRQTYERRAANLLTLMVMLLVLGTVPLVYDTLKDLGKETAVTSHDFQINGTRSADGTLRFSGALEAPATGTMAATQDLPGWIGLLSTLFGALSGIFAFIKSGRRKKGHIPMGLVVVVATAALWFGLLLLTYHIADWLLCNHSWAFIGLLWGIIIAVAVAIGWRTNMNYLAIHRYYRDRLMELFMPDMDRALDGKITTRAAASADKMPIHDLLAANAGSGPAANPAPYHLINTNVVLESSTIPKFRGRGGDNFILSPYFCGSNATGWRKSEDFMDGHMTLPTAMAISGAAVNPGTGIGGQGVTRQPLLSMLMGLLNIRLGYWAPNPDPNPGKTAAARRPGKQNPRKTPNFLFPGLYEMFLRSRLNEESDFVQLTDGGHFENLALYELIRRRTRLIVLCDGGADPDYQFTDFANVVEKVRVDFGTLILCDCESLQPLIPRRKTTAGTADDAMQCAERGYIMCTIIYPDNSQGRLLYLKTSFFEQLSADLYGYKKTHPQFPDEPTSDQFFDEKQFEAYRELGFQTAWRMMQDDNIRNDAFVRPLWTKH